MSLRIGRGRLATGAAAAVLALLAPLGGAAARAQSQSPETPADAVTITYLDAITESVVTTPPNPISPNGTVSFNLFSAYLDDPAVSQGSAFIVQPVIDPRVDIDLSLVNESSDHAFFDSMTFAAGPGLYFDSSDSSDLFFSVNFDLPNPDMPDYRVFFGDPLGGTHYGSITFFTNPDSDVPQGHPWGETVDYFFSFHTPEPLFVGQSFYMEVLPNGAPFVPLDAVPEPGAVATGLTLLGGTCLGLVRGRLRRRAAPKA